MYCSKCGTQNLADAHFCKNCGASLSSSSNQYFPNQEYEKKEESLNPAYIILAILIPLIGIIQYFMWKKDQPKKANSVILWAIVGIVINLIFFAS